MATITPCIRTSDLASSNSSSSLASDLTIAVPSTITPRQQQQIGTAKLSGDSMSSSPSTAASGVAFSSLQPIRSLEIPPTEGMLAQLTKPMKRLRMRQHDGPGHEESSRAEETGRASNRSKFTADSTDRADAFDECEKAEEVDLDQFEWTYPEGGWRAWSVVFACWVFAASQLAFGMCWGVLVEDLSRNHYPDIPLSTLNLVMGLAAFLMNGFAFVSGRLGDKFGYKPIIAIGSILYIVFLVASAFSVDRLLLLFVFLGGGLGVAVGCTFPLVCALPSQWFLKRRGFASGIAVSGTGLGGAIGSLIMRGLLPTLGFKKMLLVYAGINAFTTAAAFPLLRTREPPRLPGQPRVAKNWLPKGVWKDGAFYSFISCVFIGIFGYLVPYAFLVTYTVKVLPHLGSGLRPAAPLIVANAASGIGRICAGLVADRVGPVNMLFASWFFGGLLQLVFWPLATTFPSIVAFGALYGFTGAWFVSLLPMAAAQLFGMDGLATITGFMILVNAPGQFGGGPIGGLILTAAGGDYKPVAYFGGGTMMLGSLLLIYARFSRQPKILAKF